jgi:hypothetical protein
MKYNLALAGGLFAILASCLTGSQKASAQTCNYYAGTAVTGQSVNVDLCSITQASAQSMNFVYYLGRQRIKS